MSAPLRRRREPEPLGRGWEVAFVVTATVLGVVGCAALAGAGLAAAWWGGGWVWPPTAQDMGPAVVGVLTGSPGLGYPAPLGKQLAGPAPTYALVAISEVLILTAVALIARGVPGRFGPGSRSGFATRAQAEQALGVSALRAARSVIRPDLTQR